MFAAEQSPSNVEELLDVPAQESEPEPEDNDGRKWKGKAKAIAATGNITADSVASNTSAAEIEVDWREYEPPSGLMHVADTTSDIIIQIIQESIDKIKTKLVEQQERREAAAETEKLRMEREATAESEKAKALEVLQPTIQVHEEDPGTKDGLPGTANSYTSSHSAEFAAFRLAAAPFGAIQPAPQPKSKKRKLMALLRRLNSTEKGESSAAGALRHEHNYSIGSQDSNTHSASKRLTIELVTKVVSNSSSSPRISINENITECVSCLDEFDPKDMVKAICHSYCYDCFERLITAACENEQQWPPKCCLNDIPERIVLANTNNEIQRRYRSRAEEWNIPVSDRLYCGQAECSLWIKPDQVNHALGAARCTNEHWTCTICRGPQHTTNQCPQDWDMMRTEELAEEEGWKRCYGCHAYVEHREACQHMTCICGAEFCYVCGARWRTCGCTMEQLAAVKRSAATRREAREAEQAREEAELAEALRLIEEFEREEALKAELLRQEQERLAEERRQRELEERIKKEGARRRAVEIKFGKLRESLGNLHEIQVLAVARDHGKEESVMNHEAESAMEKLQEEQKADREAVLAETSAKLTERECALNSDYIARLNQERCIEEEYHLQLQVYWAGKKGGEQKVEIAFLDLKRKMDQGFRAYRKWKENELEAYQFLVKEEGAIQLELMQEVERRLVQTSVEQQEAFAKRRAADLRWLSVVIEERDSMLNEMEVDEIENGEDIDTWFAEDVLNNVDDMDDDLQEYKVPGSFL
ncbi:hypothetical protein BJ170DRAFT_28141 [Xylariales sp. AK1849]|nr:hypothetical protein BJ170DRAFT_28141 [Xylariales sp. AK1849]